MNLRSLATALLALAGPAFAETGLLYQTTFSEFPVGENNWAGNEGWFTNSEATSTSVQGIDDQVILGLSKSAFLGFNEPATRWTYVAKLFNHDSSQKGSALIEVDTLLGVQDSTNGQNDSFFVSVYNIQGQFLAAIQLSTEEETYGIWRDDGEDLTDTTVDFITGELQLLVLNIDLINNRWSAEHDGIPLFTDQIFTKTINARTFGSLAYEWQVTDPSPTNHGDNWLLVADCSVWAIPHGQPRVEIFQPVITALGQPSFHFTGEPGWTYQIEYTHSFSDWRDDLPDSRFEVTSGIQNIEFIDESSRAKSARFYRVTREVTP
ncbi:hypothetical protein V2O64_08980 [Verrucomicrobiaceae bacterium 227]